VMLKIIITRNGKKKIKRRRGEIILTEREEGERRGMGIEDGGTEQWK